MSGGRVAAGHGGNRGWLKRVCPGLALVAVVAIVTGFDATGVFAQDKGSLNPRPLPRLTNPDDPALAAKELFGRQPLPANSPARAIGSYARGCLAGATALPINGRTWQVMRLSRNRNWGHPDLVSYLERLAERAPRVGWRGLLVGDMAQARGGPMLTGHASHQIGLDADIWLTPMPEREFTRREREEISATQMVAKDRRDVDPRVWTPAHVGIIRAAAQDPAVDRIFVNAAIKKALCRADDRDRRWLAKVRPWWGHDYHFHVRIGCPAGSAWCEPQAAVPTGDGCGKELDYWFSDAVLNPPPPKTPPKPRPPLRLADLPAACRQVVLAP